MKPEIKMTPTEAQAKALAQQFHEAYERLAPTFGYTTRVASAKPWEDVPENNRKLMEAVCQQVMVPAPTDAYDRGKREQREKDAALCESLAGKAHTYSSENADVYYAYDNGLRHGAQAIRAQAGQEEPK